MFAHGSESNQVWTNLIDNAIDAMGGTGELGIRTFRELDCVVVEIVDNGPGITRRKSDVESEKGTLCRAPAYSSLGSPAWF